MKKAGRPRQVADLPKEQSSVNIRRRFYDAIDHMSWSEREALRRSLNYSAGAIHWGWKKRQRFPNLLTAIRVIEWYDSGCPIRLEKHDVSFLDL